METTVQALYLTSAGMGVLFLAMALLMVLMAWLVRSFPVGPAAPEGLPQQATGSEPTEIVRERVAVIAVALALAERQAADSPSRGSQQDAGSWVAAGRQQSLRSRRPSWNL